MKIALEVYQYERCPKFYGLAWWEMDRMVAVCYPIPFNWICRVFRDLYLKLRQGPQWEDAKQKVYKKGFEDCEETWRKRIK